MTGGEFPSVHLGMSIQQNSTGDITLSSHDYIRQVVERVKQLVNVRALKTHDSTTKDNWEPELDETPLLDSEGIKLYQRLIGIGIWLICIGRFDINFAVNQLSHFTQAPREGHVVDALRIFGFLDKYPKVDPSLIILVIFVIASIVNYLKNQSNFFLQSLFK